MPNLRIIDDGVRCRFCEDPWHCRHIPCADCSSLMILSETDEAYYWCPNCGADTASSRFLNADTMATFYEALKIGDPTDG